MHLRAFLDGRPVDFSALAAAVRDGAILDLSRVEVALADRPYLSREGEPVPDELAGYSPVSSEFLRKGPAMTLRLASSAPGWRSFCSDPDRLDSRLRKRLDGGAPILLTSRFSTPTGVNARTSTINSVHAAARVLARQSGLDVIDVIPSREDLDLRLLNAPATRTKRLGGGTDLRHHFVVVDLRPSAPVVILLATGSGRLAGEGFVQPFVQKAAELVLKVDAAILATKRWDRTNRNDDLVGPLLTSMEMQASWLCTEKKFEEVNEQTKFMLHVESYAAGANTGSEDHAKRQGQADATGRRMRGGQVAYRMPSPVPPGLGVVTLKRRPGLPKERVAYLDTPGCRPDASRVADGASQVLDDEGAVVDQVAAVRFFLARYGRPEWRGGTRLIDAMSEQKLSTVHMRAQYGADAYLMRDQGVAALETILANLDMYETGVLRRSPGGEVPTVEISGVMPPDGPWAEPDDFTRIRTYMAKGKARAGKKVTFSLAGLRCTYDDVPARTRSGSLATRRSSEPFLRFFRTADGGERVVDRHVPVPVAALAESIEQAIIGAGATVLEPFVKAVTETADVAAGERRATRQHIEQQIADLEREQATLVAQLGETDANGQRVLRGGFLRAAQDRYDNIDDKELPGLRAQLQGLDDADGHEMRTKQPSESLKPDLLLHLLASLKDPTDRTYSKLWRQVVDVRFTTGAGSNPGSSSRMLSWQGAIRLDAGVGGTVLLPFRGSYDYRRVQPGQRRFERRTQEYVDALLAGTPFDECALPGRHVTRPHLAEMLGIDVAHPLFACTSSLIVSTATALLLLEQGREVARPGNVDPDVVEAVKRVHVDDRSARQWRRPVAPFHAAIYELAADDGVVTTAQIVDHCKTTRQTVYTEMSKLRQRDRNWTTRRKQGYVLAPCPHCGSHDRRPVTILEIVGLVCVCCGRDEDGVRWPPEVVRDYLATSK